MAFCVLTKILFYKYATSVMYATSKFSSFGLKLSQNFRSSFQTGVSNFDCFLVFLVSIFGYIFGKFCESFGHSKIPVFFWSSFCCQKTENLKDRETWKAKIFGQRSLRLSYKCYHIGFVWLYCHSSCQPSSGSHRLEHEPWLRLVRSSCCKCSCPCRSSRRRRCWGDWWRRSSGGPFWRWWKKYNFEFNVCITF